jgi:tetratricopeptide (TPR) repeat protein
MSSNNPSNPKKGPGKLNIFVGGPPPPGAVVFRPDGTIERAPATPEAQHEWTVRKMTSRIEQEPEDGEWYFERGTALVALGRFAEAIPDFSKLIDLVPKWGDYYRLRGLCFYHTSSHAQALDDLREYRRLRDPQRLESDAIKILEELEGARQE